MPPDHTRANRVRDNQRRFRERRKEYVTELETSLRELRRQGVEASREVQLAAQEVARENKLLRRLLNSYGLDGDAVDDWIRKHVDVTATGDHSYKHTIARCVRVHAEAKIKTTCTARAADTLQRVDVISDWLPVVQLGTSATEPLAQQSWENSPEAPPFGGSGSSSISSDRSTPVDLRSRSLPTAIKCSRSCACAKIDTSTLALLEDPQDPTIHQQVANFMVDSSMDLQHFPCSEDFLTGISQYSDGIECCLAYEMLVQYATTDDKLEYIAIALERGCIESPDGGCRVKNETVFETLDKLTS